MRRTIETYKKGDPFALAHNQSANAAMFAFEDMHADIIELWNENQRLKEIARMIAFPRRGTAEESYNIMDMAKLIQSAYTAESLWNEIAEKKANEAKP